jgi:hypothetical protein
MSKTEIQFAKTHLRNHLATLVLPHVSDGIWSIYDNAKVLCEKNREIEQTLRTFQNLLTRIAVWTNDTLTTEVKRIEIASKCEYLEELITGVFLAYMRAFAAMQYRSNADSIEIEFEKPSIDTFIHELYKQVARGAWQHAYLFKTYGVSSEQQARNRKEITQLLEDSLDTVIDSFLPWKDIAKNYFKEVQLPATTPAAVAATVAPDHEEDEEEDEEEEEEKPKRGVTFNATNEDEDEVPAIEIGEDVAVELEVEALDSQQAPTEEKVDLSPEDGATPLVLKQ